MMVCIIQNHFMCDYSLLFLLVKYVAMDLVKDMISNNSKFRYVQLSCLDSSRIVITLFHFRPTSCEVISHCFFWSKARTLAFFQDVSDRIEKEPFTSPIVQALEQGGLNVVRRDWRENITEDLKEGTCMVPDKRSW